MVTFNPFRIFIQNYTARVLFPDLSGRESEDRQKLGYGLLSVTGNELASVACRQLVPFFDHRLSFVSMRPMSRWLEQSCC